MKSDMGHNEWAGEEMSLKQVNKNNPFTVPAGYFEESGQHILSLIRLNEIKTDGSSAGFTVPEDYFEHSGNYISSLVNAEMFTFDAEPGFIVPAGYFEELTDHIQGQVNITSVINTETTGFSVPEDYFSSLGQQINSRLTVDAAVDDHPAFTVPENYFEKLNKGILNRTVNQDMVIRKTIVRKLFASNTFKYATAACLTLIIGAGVFLREAGAPVTHTHTYLHSQLSDVPVNEIKDYLELHIDASDTHGIMENDKQINTQALDASLQDYIDVN